MIKDFFLLLFLVFFSRNLYANGILVKANTIDFSGSSLQDRKDGDSSFLPNDFKQARTVGIGFVKSRTNTSLVDLSIDVGTNQICTDQDCRASYLAIIGAGLRFRSKDKLFLETGASLNGLILNSSDYNLSASGVSAQIGAGFRASDKFLVTVLGSKSAFIDTGAENSVVMTSIGITIDFDF